jgi:hypothetical protein
VLSEGFLEQGDGGFVHRFYFLMTRAPIWR